MILAAPAIVIFVAGVLAFIHLFSPISELVRFFAPLGASAAGTPVVYFLLVRWRKRLVDRLTSAELYSPNAASYIESLDITRPQQVVMYVSAGIIGMAHSVYDGTFMIPMCQKFDTFALWYLMTSILALVPDNPEAFGNAVQSLCEKCGESLYRQLVVARFLRLQEMRSDNGPRFSHAFDKAVLRTRRTIVKVKEAWRFVAEDRPEGLTMGLLDYLAREIHRCKDMWLDLLSRYRTRTSVLREYSVFKIECRADFRSGLIYRVKADHPERIDPEPDPLFARFCRSRPGVITDGFMLANGRLRGLNEPAQRRRVDSSGSSASSSSESESAELGIEDGFIAELGSENLEYGSLRTALWRTTTRYSPQFLTLARVLSICAFSLWLVGIIASFLTFRSRYSDLEMVYVQSERLVELRLSLSFFRAAVLLDWAEAKGLLFENKSHYTFASLDFANLRQGQADWASVALSDFSSIHEVAEAKYNHHGLNSNLVATVRSPVVPEIFCYLDRATNAVVSISAESSTPVRAVAMTLWDEYRLRDIKASERLDGAVFCHLDHIVNLVPSLFRLILSELVEMIDKANSIVQSEKIQILVAELVIACLVFIPIIAAPHILIRTAVKTFFNAIRSISPDVAEEAIQPFMIPESSLRDVEPNLPPDVDRAHFRRNISQLLLYVVSFGAVICLFSSPAWFVAKAETALVDLVRLMSMGSQRHPLSVEIWNYCLMHSISSRYPISYVSSMQLLSLFEDAASKLLEYHEKYVIGRSDFVETHGTYIPGRSEETCKYDTCWGEVSNLPEFVRLARAVFEGDLPLDSDKFQDLSHSLLLVLDPLMRQTRDLDDSTCDAILSRAWVIAVTVSTIAAAVLVFCFVIDQLYISAILAMLRTAVLMIRHIPPHRVVHTRSLLEIFLPANADESHDAQNVSQLIVDSCSTPIAFVGEGLIIDWVNAAFRKTYQMSAKTVVGRPLDEIIPRAMRSSLETWDEDEAHLYENLELMNDGSLNECSCMTKCMTEGQSIPVMVSAFGVRNSGIVVFVENRIDAEIAISRLNGVKRHVESLQNQLVPKELATFAENPESVTFVTKTATVVAVQIHSVADLVAQDYGRFEFFISLVEGVARRNPPFFLQKIVFNTLYIMGGLFQDDAEPQDHAVPAMPLAQNVSRELSRQLAASGGKRFSIAVTTGGPLLCLLIGKTRPVFEVVGSLIDQASDLVAAAPGDSRIVSEAYKAIVGDAVQMQTTRGPVVLEQATFVVT
jgi:hypothetical protein